jgi:hypothetical protein
LQPLIDAMRHSREEQIRSQFSGMGLEGSPMEQQALSEFDVGASGLGTELASGTIDQSTFRRLINSLA